MSKTAARGGLGSVMKAAAAGKKKETTETELRSKETITPDDVLGLSKPCQGACTLLHSLTLCEGFLCKTTDNVYGIDFTAFKLRDLDHNTTLFEVANRGRWD